MDTKAQLRSRVLARRDALPEEDRARKSATICARLEQHLCDAFATRARGGASEAAAPAVAVFASMRSEVDTQAFVDAAYRRGWEVCFPCMVREADGQPACMRFYRVTSTQLDAARARFLDTPLRCLACAALEADGFAAIAAEDLDAVVVPLVAFDDDGNRLGYGGGNYDRLLPALRDDAVIAGIAFEEQRVEAVPVEPHDRPLPHIVTA